MAESKAYKLGVCAKCGVSKELCTCINAPDPIQNKHTPIEGIVEIEEHEMTEFEGQLAQAILAALEYRGFYDCGKYLDTSLIERIRPLLQSQADKYEKEKGEMVREMTGCIYSENVIRKIETIAQKYDVDLSE